MTFTARRFLVFGTVGTVSLHLNRALIIGPSRTPGRSYEGRDSTQVATPAGIQGKCRSRLSDCGLAKLSCTADWAGLPVDCRWIARGLPVDCRWIAGGLSMDCRWTVDGLPVRWTVDGLPVRWTVDGLPVDCLRIAGGLSMDCRWPNYGLTVNC